MRRAPISTSTRGPVRIAARLRAYELSADLVRDARVQLLELHPNADQGNRVQQLLLDTEAVRVWVCVELVAGVHTVKNVPRKWSRGLDNTGAAAAPVTFACNTFSNFPV